MSKELEKESRNAHIENLKREQEDIKKAIKGIEDRKKLVSRSIELEKEKRQIILDNFKILKPNWAYEDQERYLEIMKEQLQISWQIKDEQTEGEKSQVESQAKSYQEQLQSIEEEIDRLEEVE